MVILVLRRKASRLPSRTVLPGTCQVHMLDKPVKLIQDMEEGVKECLLYLPLRSELSSVKVGVEEGRLLEILVYDESTLYICDSQNCLIRKVSIR